MRVVIRADASAQIGSGHVMRCLTLADELRQNGCKVEFICRELVGNLIELVQGKGYTVWPLPAPIGRYQPAPDDIEHAAWREVDWSEDAGQTLPCLQSERVDWLVIDHYGLDYRWQGKLRASVDNILVIDDLADRAFDCDLLLDQNLFSDMHVRYEGKIPESCDVLLGPQYALLRPEFRDHRKNMRTNRSAVRRILVFFGGADPSNETSRVLHALDRMAIQDLHVDVVVGSANPESRRIQALCEQRAYARFHCQVSNIAELMVGADLGLGAAGVATWERCALGLPAIVVAVAYNQRAIAEAVSDAGAIQYLGRSEDIELNDWVKAVREMVNDPCKLKRMSEICSTLVDCEGVRRVADRMMTTQ